MRTQFKNTILYSLFFALFLIGCNDDEDKINTPADVSNFTAVRDGKKVTLTWSKSTDPDLKEYWLTINPLIMDAFSIDKDLDTYTFEDLPANVEYTFTLMVKNQSGGVSTGVSTIASASSEVTNLAASTGDSKVTLNWTKPSGMNLGGYQLTYSPGEGSVSLGSDVQSHTIEGLTNGTEYTFVLKTKDLNNNISEGSSVKATPIVPDVIPPVEATSIAFSGIYVSPGPGSTFTISWVNPSDSDFQECKLTYSSASTIPVTVATIPKTQNSFTITGAYGEKHTLTLQTKDASGNLSAGITKKIHFGNFDPLYPNLANFDPEIVAIIAGKLIIDNFSVATSLSLDKLSNLEQIEGKLEIINNSSTTLTNLNAFQKLKKVAGNITITGNTSLSDFCGLKNLFSNGGVAPGTYTVSGNSSNPTKQDIIDNCN